MKIKELIKTAQKPALYTRGTAEMWVDEYISTQLLKTHLNPDMDLASRKDATISLTVGWILEKAFGHRMNILDLGCGPGLYTEKLAEKGHQVTGMDFSANSIRYAGDSAAGKKLNISYIQQDYLELNEESRYDLILMIFTDF
ncbi:MAG: class I SAM-dependent methyltransferase, partial [Deltaproteobacteria bacterium]|nr:class I SAM-dependent methyltransferase [Deltaproteobacteria bacterium]